jgi:hypothetical protein
MAIIRRKSTWIRRCFEGPFGRARKILTVLAALGMLAFAASGAEMLYIEHERTTLVESPCFMEFAVTTRENAQGVPIVPAWHYVPTVRFKYEVKTVTYESHVVSSRRPVLTTRAESDAFLQKYGPGASATCFVHPDDPEDAMLMLPGDANVVMYAKAGLMAIVLAATGLILLFLCERIETRPKPKRGDPRNPGWGAIDSGRGDPLARSRGILKEKLER